MNLLLDIGNTQLKWATVTAGEFKFGGTLPHQGCSLAQLFQQHWHSLPTPTQILVSNVAGEALAAEISEWVESHWQVPVEFIKTSSEWRELKNGYENPDQLGVDRWLNLVAAWQKYHIALCVVGCGTAITFDLVQANGQHRGGFIIPGIELMRTALTEHTAKCHWNPENTVVNTQHLGTNTQMGIAGGTLEAAVAFINQATQQAQEETSDVLQLVITGGAANELLPRLANSYVLHPYLCLEGIYLVTEAK